PVPSAPLTYPLSLHDALPISALRADPDYAERTRAAAGRGPGAPRSGPRRRRRLARWIDQLRRAGHRPAGGISEPRDLPGEGCGPPGVRRLPHAPAVRRMARGRVRGPPGRP